MLKGEDRKRKTIRNENEKGGKKGEGTYQGCDFLRESNFEGMVLALVLL